MLEKILYLKLADPARAARRDAERILADKHAALYAELERTLAISAPHVDPAAVLDGLADYHRDAMGRIPDDTRYPEARPWVDYQLAYERELRAAAGLDDREVGLAMSLAPYLQFRGYRQFALRGREAQDDQCRGVFLPDTDRGPMYIFNMDDPLPPDYAPQPPLPAERPRVEFWWKQARLSCFDAGSGLHLDDEPAELFPLPVDAMLPHFADDVPGAVDFLTRYAPFWSGGNRVYYDADYRGAAIEKCSRHFCDAYDADDAGFFHAGGMVCRDGASAQAQYLWAKRWEYLLLFGLGDDSVDMAYWTGAQALEDQLVAAMRRLGARPRVADVIALFTTPSPDGLWKTGRRTHPQQTAVSCTLLSVATLFEEAVDLRWQRGKDGCAGAVEACRYV